MLKSNNSLLFIPFFSLFFITFAPAYETWVSLARPAPFESSRTGT